ncbi:MAG: alpha-L-fucosidase [Victivallales bacterium]
MKKMFHDGRNWFFEKRFGLFVHWGLYAVNAWHEQEQFRKGLCRHDYTHLIGKFNPVNFNPDQWLDIAEKAGMQYLCFTAKHIDGFCMWNTRQTEYNITNTPYRRDIFGMLAEACHRRDLPLCIYYSVPDMNCKYYPNQGRSYELPGPEQGDEPDLAKYVEFVKAQVTELCTNYGKIHGFWWDANFGTLKHQDESVNKIIRSLQPGIIINNRGFDDGDFSTPERDYDDAKLDGVKAYAKPTEACESIGSESWGYRSNEDYFSVGALTRSITKHMAKGGNYLLNVGPQADGTFPAETVRILEKIGQWHRRVGEAFEQVELLSLTLDNGKVLLGRKGNALYVYLLDAPRKSGVVLKPLDIQPKKAMLLNNGQELKAKVEIMPSMHSEHKAYLHVWDMPVDELSNEAVILKLEFEEGVTEALR